MPGFQLYRSVTVASRLDELIVSLLQHAPPQRASFLPTSVSHHFEDSAVILALSHDCRICPPPGPPPTAHRFMACLSRLRGLTRNKTTVEGLVKIAPYRDAESSKIAVTLGSAAVCRTCRPSPVTQPSV
jgi:hypothetical protein